MTGSDVAVESTMVYDNTTIASLGATTVGTTGTWCSTATGTAQSYAVIVSDNSTAGGNAGILVSQVMDNGTITAMGVVADGTILAGKHTDLELCALTYLGGTFYLALTDEDASGGDNVSVWKSTTLSSWSQIGEDLSVVEDVVSIAISTLGTSVSDNAVWVAVNDGGTVKVLHYEDVAGGSTNVWRSVGEVLNAAGTSGVSISTDGTSVVAVTAVIAGTTTVGFWYNQ